MMAGLTSLWPVIRLASLEISLKATWEDKGLKRSEGTPVLAYNEDGRELRVWHAAAADFDGDGHSTFSRQTSLMIPTIHVQELGRETTSKTIPSAQVWQVNTNIWAGTAFGDFDNDGCSDLIVANGQRLS